MVVLGAMASTTAFAQQPMSTPYPDATPSGEFRVEPISGPVGTVVTLTGNLDQGVTVIRFRCFYPDASEGLIDQPLGTPTTSFSFPYQIPATLSIRQGGGATRPTSAGTCDFLAIASHPLLARSATFEVTAGLPATGFGPADERPLGPAMVAFLLTGVLLAGGCVAFWTRRRSA